METELLLPMIRRGGICNVYQTVLGFFGFLLVHFFLFSSTSINHLWDQLSSSKINSCNYTSDFQCSVIEELSAEN